MYRLSVLIICCGLLGLFDTLFRGDSSIEFLSPWERQARLRRAREGYQDLQKSSPSFEIPLNPPLAKGDGIET